MTLEEDDPDPWKECDRLRAEIKKLTGWGGERVIEVCTLRAEVERLQACLHDYENTYPHAKDSLRAENERLEDIKTGLENEVEDCIKIANRYRAENERLREALKKIADAPVASGAKWRRAIARAALKQGE
jgi:predicted  nucleic acid-binding Zn-ribbon protein